MKEFTTRMILVSTHNRHGLDVTVLKSETEEEQFHLSMSADKMKTLAKDIDKYLKSVEGKKKLNPKKKKKK